MGDCPLLLGESIDGHKGVRTNYGNEEPAGGFAGAELIGKGRIAVAEHTAVVGLVAHETFKPMVYGGLKVAHQLVESPIIGLRPFGCVAGAVADRPQEIEPDESGAVEGLHHDLGRILGEDASLLKVVGVDLMIVDGGERPGS